MGTGMSHIQSRPLQPVSECLICLRRLANIELRKGEGEVGTVILRNRVKEFV